MKLFAKQINEMVEEIHKANVEAGWWHDLETGEPLELTPERVCQKMLLAIGEIIEASEGFRKNLMDDKIPHRRNDEVEFGDVLLRIFDLAGKMEMDLGGGFDDKRLYNVDREDHKRENRLGENGKKF